MTLDQTSPLLRGLTGPQRQAVMSDDAPLCVLAGAGSGKTTVLTRRVARRIFDATAEAGHSLVVTFTRKAARELRDRLWRLEVPGPVFAGTFHAAAYSQLRRHGADSGVRPPALIDDPRRLLRRVIEGSGTASREAASGETGSLATGAPESVAALLAEIEWAQAGLVGPESYAAAARAAGRRTPGAGDEVAEIYRRYVDAKRTHAVMDLNDLLTRCAELLETDRTAAAAARWRIRHLYVDEFQDLNPAQWRLLRAWMGDSTDLFVVGDPRQAVYGWNGADPTLLDRLPELLPGTTVLRLDANHRSTPQVIAAARSVLDPLAMGPGAANAAAAPPADGGTTVGRGRPDGPGPTVTGFDDDQAEAEAVARWLRVMHRPGRPWSHLAVLARTNGRLGPVAAALTGAGIPFRVGPAPRTGAALAGAVRALRAMPAGRPLRSALADLSLGELPPGGDRAGARSGPAGGGIPGVLSRLADEHAVEEPGSTVGAFLAWLAATAGDAALAEADPEGDAVELSTFHRAKGLEWPAVALVGLEDGLVPIAYATRRRPATRSVGSSTWPSPGPKTPLVLLGPPAPRRGPVMVEPPLPLPRRHRGYGPGRPVPGAGPGVRHPDGLAPPTPSHHRLSPSSETPGLADSPAHGVTSTKTGAWSDGCFPLRALRSMRA